MDPAVDRALSSDRTVDITTTGRRTGIDRRVEIWFHNVDGEVYVTGTPGTRGWYANLVADPSLTFHLKESVRADLSATAIPITDEGERRAVLAEITRRIAVRDGFEEWVLRSPLIRVDFD
jgi:deazaflavin-dependent oxidoreductase (nitroreductase family)